MARRWRGLHHKRKGDRSATNNALRGEKPGREKKEGRNTTGGPGRCYALQGCRGNRGHGQTECQAGEIINFNPEWKLGGLFSRFLNWARLKVCLEGH